ncbi:6-phosphofructokinase [Actinomyces minihominis]|uniref:6-phosphofructokinase n=1 Tax=Actinomyces minihominis TaxID=2002838 RepID=UPI000C08C249|nr:6-phosphofructokinase [Actinomyces minihominis]
MSVKRLVDYLPDEVVSGTNRRTGEPYRLGVLTSGGDAQGMNAAVRAVVRTALAAGAQPFAILEGWDGAVRGGEFIKQMDWSSVSSILGRGGTAIGTARSAEFRNFEGRQKAAKHLVDRRIDGLIVIGGDGSLTGADEFRSEWGRHLSDLVAAGQISEEVARNYPQLTLVGLVGSIDNDLVGTDMTIGADTALSRIISAMDMLASTAASHQRTFIVEVMGRHCGYLPLMAGVAGGADYVFTPEQPPTGNWRDDMCEKLQLGRDAGRRESIILVAEGALDTDGNDLTTEDVKQALQDGLGEDARVTILGHIQRGGAPTAYDRWMSTLLGYAAVQELFDPEAYGRGAILGIRRNRVTRLPLEESIKDTRAVGGLIQRGEYVAARKARGQSYYEMGSIFATLSAPPQLLSQQPRTKRVAILHAGGLAPGMNTAVRAAVRLGIDSGWEMLGIEGSWQGLIDEQIRPLDWEGVEGWAFDGGAVLGTRRHVPKTEQYYAIGRAIDRNNIDALFIIGGYTAYEAVQNLDAARVHFPAFNIPLVLIPASIDNNLPGNDLSIGADSAINNAVWSLDRIKESAAASKRTFVAEAMGRKCGYLALMSGIASGAEYIYLNEEELTLDELSHDLTLMRRSFEEGRRVFMVVMNEETSSHYDREFISRAIEAAGEGLFDVRDSALGHIQQGGMPSAFDRILATRLTHSAVTHLRSAFLEESFEAVYIGMDRDGVSAHPIGEMAKLVDVEHRRPRHQWWLPLRHIGETVSLENSGLPVRKIEIPESPPTTSTEQLLMNEVEKEASR